MARQRPMILLEAYQNTNFTFGNVTGLSAKPSIRLEGEPQVTPLPNGEIVFQKQLNGGNTEHNLKRSERHLIIGYCQFAGGASDQTVNEMFAEFWRICDKYSADITKEEVFKVLDNDYNGSFTEGQVKFTVESYRPFVSATGV